MVCECPEREEIRALVERQTMEGFRRYEWCRSDNGMRCTERREHAEIDEFTDPVARDTHVARAQIPME